MENYSAKLLREIFIQREMSVIFVSDKIDTNSFQTWKNSNIKIALLASNILTI